MLAMYKTAFKFDVSFIKTIFTENISQHMNFSQLSHAIKEKKSFLCIGLDTDITKIPEHLRHHDDAVFEFNKKIIDATAHLCVAYKPNTAFYECRGSEGWKSLQKTLEYIPENIFTIADAKRGDIGNTGMMYAQAFYDQMNFDGVTVAPYMGKDSVTPFLRNEKFAIVLALTSNAGSLDFQMSDLSRSDGEREKLFERVLKVSSAWGSKENMMYVVGATQASMMKEVRKIVPEHFLLVPGVGAQGGSLEEVCENGMTKDCGLLINSSRQIIYASSEKDFAEAARAEALKVQQEMQTLLRTSKII